MLGVNKKQIEQVSMQYQFDYFYEIIVIVKMFFYPQTKSIF